MIDLAILGLLCDQPLHGYELRKRLAELPAGAGAVSFGSLYPALARLERAGAVRALRPTGNRSPATPMTGALSGEIAAFRATDVTAPGGEVSGRRAKKVYAVTDAGRDRLVTLLLDPTNDDRVFELQVAFCRHLDARQRVGLFESRLAALVSRVDAATRTTGTAPAPVDPYLRSLREHHTSNLQGEQAWASELLGAARRELTADADLAPVSGGTHP